MPYLKGYPKTFVCSSSTEICVCKLIEKHACIQVCAVLPHECSAEYKWILTALDKHISVLDEHKHFLRLPLPSLTGGSLEITLTAPLTSINLCSW